MLPILEHPRYMNASRERLYSPVLCRSRSMPIVQDGPPNRLPQKQLIHSPSPIDRLFGSMEQAKMKQFAR